ncbi:MFS transporter [Corynebacterium minutissimum]|uniref:MFS transporter n=1 Tax=Corynebacterium minutissimum TaxID=38301 RepID=A0A2X4RBC5_9CORY|nr:MFS transporter [Corynebacterium minutissimum]KHO29187.1 MFS transporter permease [Corynebacterium minutissimum]QPS59341.1 MFS transporter [Corynebacterium minutissimum]QQA79870.1 MFS transporter [Corynebacterium minutissimum]SQH99309.1 permease of the major facilitator superfamily [Corynebacterium minutissimum]VEG06469.1 permease of the major facilitator superfamily [Corynebacterium minutissimum]
MSAPHPREVITTKALSVWVAAMLVYIVAMTGRTSFGVAGLEAIDRFEVDASRIAVFTSVQLGVYALAQIPTGLLIDKFGPRRLLVIGSVIMGIGQVVLGFTANYWVAIAARILIGLGDATAFLSVMRILPYWFPLHRTPMFTQVTSSLGQLGQFMSAIPFSLVLGWAGWTTAFVTLGAVGILIAVAAAVAVADSPETLGIVSAPKERPNAQPRRLGSLLASVLRSPVAWQAFFIHWVGLAATNVFVMLWGMPMMTAGLDFSKTEAGWVLTWFSVCMVLVGPLHGKISSRASGYRPWLALGFVAVNISVWVVFFLAGGSYLSLFILISLVSLCTPVANYGFDIVRENLDRTVVATATGLGNMGGFISSMLGAQLFGVALDHLGHGPDYPMADFRLAAFAVLGVWCVGIVGVLITHFLRGKDSGPRATIVQVG